MSSPTPSDLVIHPRDRHFGRDTTQRRWWHGGDPYLTALYNAMSVTFPRGEAFFVESVRTFRDGVPPRLAEETAAFTRQEVVHSREHLAFNKSVAEAGYDVSALHRAVDARLAHVRTKRPIASLAATMALEHFTAILAHELLSDPRHLAGADAEAAALWRWHACEEIEHKGVAHDVWLHATRDWPRPRRWFVKSFVMVFVTRNFLKDRTLGALDLLAQDGLSGPRAWARLFHAAFVKPGMMRRILGSWAAYFMPGFHPWNHDNRALIRTAEFQLATDG
jgi:predicted metal-dependent hydrolase